MSDLHIEIDDIEDLEDNLAAMELVADELKKPRLSEGELEVVLFNIAT